MRRVNARGCCRRTRNHDRCRGAHSPPPVATNSRFLITNAGAFSLPMRESRTQTPLAPERFTPLLSDVVCSDGRGVVYNPRLVVKAAGGGRTPEGRAQGIVRVTFLTAVARPSRQRVSERRRRQISI
jgi:hypothetical protein